MSRNGTFFMLYIDTFFMSYVTPMIHFGKGGHPMTHYKQNVEKKRYFSGVTLWQ